MGFGSSWSGTGPLVATSLTVVGNTNSGNIEIRQVGQEAEIQFWNILHTKAALIRGFDPDPAGGSVSPKIEIQSSTPSLQQIDSTGTVQKELIVQGGTQPLIFQDHQGNLDELIFDTSGPWGALYVLGGHTWNNLTLQNGWVARGGGFAQPQFCVMPDDTIMLRGQIKSGTTTDGTIIATLPVNYRISVDDNFPITSYVGDHNTAASILEVSPTGNLMIFNVPAGALTVGLGGVRFPMF